VRLGHGRWRRAVSLFALGALDGAEEVRLRAHLEGCADCRDALDQTRAALAVLEDDPVRTAAPPLTAGALLARVNARLDAAETRRFRLWPAPALLSSAALLLVGLSTVVVLRFGSGSPTKVALAPETEPLVEAPAATPGSEELLRRMERQLSRDQAVRYLSEAQDVLVTLSAAPQRCRRGAGRVDVGEEARRSRELLARRALMVDLQGDEVASARPVLDDVEQVLREVAALESCARKRDLDSLHREIERRRLLMKIDLMTRELEG
jgi:putative zinc finger protein